MIITLISYNGLNPVFKSHIREDVKIMFPFPGSNITHLNALIKMQIHLQNRCKEKSFGEYGISEKSLTNITEHHRTLDDCYWIEICSPWWKDYKLNQMAVPPSVLISGNLILKHFLTLNNNFHHHQRTIKSLAFHQSSFSYVMFCHLVSSVMQCCGCVKSMLT